MKQTHNKARLGLYTFFTCVIAVILAVGINLLASALPENIKTIDTSSNDILSLSDATVDYVKDLKSKVSIYLVSERDTVDQTVLNVLNKYDALSKKLEIETVDPLARPAFIAKYTDKELENNSLIVACGERSKVIDGYSLFSFAIYGSTDGSSIESYGNMSYSDFSLFYQENSTYFENYLTYGVGYTYEMLFDGEKVITSAIDYVVSDVFPVVYYTIGHGEKELPESIVTALELDNVKCDSLSIATKKAIPDDCSLLVIAAPVSDLSDEEKDILSDYMNGGGKLFLITSHKYTELENLMSVTERYGMRAESGVITENDDNYVFSNSTADILPITQNANTFLSLDSRYFITPNAHPIYLSDDAKNGNLDIKVTYTDLFVSSENASLSKDGEKTQEDTQSYVVGMLAKSDDSAILWVSSADFLDNSYNISSAGGNFIYAVALMENLCEKRSPFSIASKTMVEDSLTITSAQSGFWAVIITVIIPLAFAIVGAAIYKKRKSR